MKECSDDFRADKPQFERNVNLAKNGGYSMVMKMAEPYHFRKVSASRL
jgi:hypothetical protein